MKTTLITGANRGIGLEFSRQYAEDGWQVLACCRHPDTAASLWLTQGSFLTMRAMCCPGNLVKNSAVWLDGYRNFDFPVPVKSHS
jgi:nucleoside-diphosphate-sugar epimerase